MWLRSVDHFDYLAIDVGGKAVGVESNPNQIVFFLSPTPGSGFGSMRTPPDFSPRLLLPTFEYSASFNAYAGVPYWMLIAPAATVWSIRFARVDRRQRRIRAGRCEFCGYDLRGTGAKPCPECGKVSLVQRRRLARHKAARVRADVHCVQCGLNLRDQPIRGACPECGHSVHRAVLEHVAATTGHSETRVWFVRIASYHIFRRIKSLGGDPARHLTARDFCLKIRDYAIEHAGSRDRALAFLRDMSFVNSEDIGQIVFGPVDVGLLQARPEDRLEDFRDLFTIEELLGVN
jgi:uncharacterized repeat protein (TIGR04138 family)